MSKRNFALLIIVLIIIVIAFFGFLFFRKSSSPTGTDTGGTNFFSQFNPFGSGTTTPPTSTPPVDVSGYNPPDQTPEVKLRKISSMPIAGFAVYQKERLKEVTGTPSPLQGEGAGGEVTSTPAKATPEEGNKKPLKPTPPPTEFAPAIRYVDRATGNIYQTFADKIEERKFSTTVIPKVYEALFGNGGQSVVMRYLKGDGRTIETFVGNLPKEILGQDTVENNEIKGVFLPENVRDMSLSGDATSLFYLFDTGNNMTGITLNFATNKKTQVFDSAFTEWLSFWPNNKMITFTTKPASSVLGYMYRIDPSVKNLNKVLGGINGLTTLTSPDGKSVLYGDSSLSLNIFHGDTKSIDAVGLRTMPEKCVWGKASDVIYCFVPKFVSGGEYPDSWYQGEVSFSDQIWKIEVKKGNITTVIVDPAVVGGEEIDGTKLALDTNEGYLLFVNKKDSFLWELSLK